MQDGVFELPAAVTKNYKTSANLNTSAEAIGKMSASGFELVIYEKVGLGNGQQANNPWLQELPDPISKITWDNYVTMAPAQMAKEGYLMMERQDREASVVTVTVNGKTIKLPVVPQPGQAEGTVGIALGYGREKAGSLSEKTGVIGQNAFPFVQVVNGTMMYGALEVSVANANETTEIAGTQIHHTLMGREIVKETNLESYKKNPKSGNHDEMLVTPVSYTHLGILIKVHTQNQNVQYNG